MQSGYPQARPVPINQQTQISAWLNPRLRKYMEAIRDHLGIHYQWKIIVLHHNYADLAEVAGLPDANAAIDAVRGLYRLGCLEIRARGDFDAIQLLDPNIDRWAGQAGRVAI